MRRQWVSFILADIGKLHATQSTVEAKGNGSVRVKVGFELFNKGKGSWGGRGGGKGGVWRGLEDDACYGYSLDMIYDMWEGLLLCSILLCFALLRFALLCFALLCFASRDAATISTVSGGAPHV